jgi:hypothetical protein
MKLELLATLWPEMPYYERFAKDQRIAGIRLNTAMADVGTLPGLVQNAVDLSHAKPLYFDVKGKQLRITEVLPNMDHLECRINHPISVRSPTPVLFKAGADGALLDHVEEDGKKLIFHGGPKYKLRSGESLNIRDPSLQVHGPLFTQQQLAFIDIAKRAGIDRYMLSYASSMAEIAEFRKLVGQAEIIAKIEDSKGLKFVKEEYRRQPNLGLLNARGDLYVELRKPHDILKASQQIIRADPRAIAGSRILLSLDGDTVPSCADINEIAWLADQGYSRFMFCDGLCLKEDALDRALNVLGAVYNEYKGEVMQKRGLMSYVREYVGR